MTRKPLPPIREIWSWERVPPTVADKPKYVPGPAYKAWRHLVFRVQSFAFVRGWVKKFPLRPDFTKEVQKNYRKPK